MTYYYQRPLSKTELAQAASIGMGVGAAVGIGIGAVVFYVARVFMQRTPLRPVPRDTSAATSGPEPFSISVVRK